MENLASSDRLATVTPFTIFGLNDCPNHEILFFRRSQVNPQFFKGTQQYRCTLAVVRY